MVFRAEGVGMDKELNAPGIQCAEDFEVAHLDCKDPKALKGESPLVLIS